MNSSTPLLNSYFFYKEDQPSYQEFKKLNLIKEWINRPPSYDEIQELSAKDKHGLGTLIICDDFGYDKLDDMARVFATGSRHWNTTIFWLVQNLFKRDLRDLSLNSNYVNIHRNPRDNSQIRHFAQQFMPDDPKFVVRTFDMVTKNRPYSSMLFDVRQECPDFLRMRSHFLPTEGPTRFYFKDENSV